MTKEAIVKKEISGYSSEKGDYINVNGLVNFLCKHLELKPEDLIDKE